MRQHYGAEMDPRHSPNRSELIAIWHDELLTLAALAAGLDDQQWQAYSPCPGWTVGDLVAHTIDIEQVLAQDARPEHEPDWAALPHATGDVGRFTEIGVDSRRGRPRADVVAELLDTTQRRLAQIQAVPDGEEVMSPFGRPTSVERLMRVRTLDVWVHEQDIRLAIGQPGGMESDAAMVTLQQFMEGLPRLWAKAAQAPAGTTVHLVISDVGRGVEAWAVSKEDARGEVSHPVVEPTVTLTLSWSDYLTLSAGRAPVDQVIDRVAIDGDHALGQRLLSSMTITP